MKPEFEGQVVVVTGGSRGIGRAIVERFAAQGAKVYFTYHQNDEAAAQVAAATQAEAIKCSQTDAVAISAAVERIVAAPGKIDVLVNNAGITADTFLMLMPAEDWDRVLDTNLNGAFRWCKAVTRPMLGARRGIIINVASIAALVGVIDSVANLGHQFQPGARVQGRRGGVLHKSPPLDELHGDEGLLTVFAGLVDGADVGMIKSGRRTCLSMEAL